MIKLVLAVLCVLCLLNITAYAAPAGKSTSRRREVNDMQEDSGEVDDAVVMSRRPLPFYLYEI